MGKVAKNGVLDYTINNILSNTYDKLPMNDSAPAKGEGIHAAPNALGSLNGKMETEEEHADTDSEPSNLIAITCPAMGIKIPKAADLGPPD